jgi:hypothetical protein
MGGLCNKCQHMREVLTGKGSRFLRCGLSDTNNRYAKYPPLPVMRCGGYQPGEPPPPDGTRRLPDHPQASEK